MSVSELRACQLKATNNISNEVFRKRYRQLEESEALTLGEVAYRCKWITKRRGIPKPDSSKTARVLGIVQENGAYREYISYDQAVLLAEALHLDFTELGI